MGVSYAISQAKYDSNKKIWFVDIIERRDREVIRKEKIQLRSVLPLIKKIFRTLPREYKR